MWRTNAAHSGQAKMRSLVEVEVCGHSGKYHISPKGFIIRMMYRRDGEHWLTWRVVGEGGLKVLPHVKQLLPMPSPYPLAWPHTSGTLLKYPCLST